MRNLTTALAVTILASVAAQASTVPAKPTGRWKFDFEANMFMGLDKPAAASCEPGNILIDLTHKSAVVAPDQDSWIAYAPSVRQDGAGSVKWNLWLIAPLQSKTARVFNFTDITAAFPDPAATGASLRGPNIASAIKLVKLQLAAQPSSSPLQHTGPAGQYYRQCA